MNERQQFKSVWDALEDDPIRVQNLKLRSAIMIEVTQKISAMGITQTDAAKLLAISQPRVSALLQGKIGKFRLDSLVNMAHRLGLNVSIRIAA